MDSFFLPPTTLFAVTSPDGSHQSASGISSSSDETNEVWAGLRVKRKVMDENPTQAHEILNPKLCIVCSNEPSTVSYFGSRICTACRSFFRRSVKIGKTYQCLNNVLCNNGLDISNRLACKFCRFQRCVESGMLDKKLMLHSDYPKRHEAKTIESNIPLVQLDVFIYKNLSPILSEFCILRRQISFERYNTYHGKETRVTVRESNSALHDWVLGMYEFDLLDNFGRRCEGLFAQLDRDDWDELMTADYAIMWVTFAQCQFTLRNNGQEDQRLFLVDESFVELRESTADRYWSHIYDSIPKDEDRNQIYKIVCSYLLLVSKNLVFHVTALLGKAKLDDTELSALLLLLFTSPSSFSTIGDRSRKLLRKWKQETLRGVAKHIDQTGRDVSVRIAEIVFLLGELQNLLSLARNSVQLSMTATKGAFMPQKFLDLIDQSNNRRLNSRVMQRLYGDFDTSVCPVN